MVKAPLAALPPRPAIVAEPTRLKLAIPVPEIPEQASRTNVTYDPAPMLPMPHPFTLKLEWDGFTIEFDEEEGSVYPCFYGNVVNVPGQLTHPQEIPAGWTFEQAEAALGWACACLCQLLLVATAAAVDPLTSWAQAAGVSVWHDR